MDLHAKIGGPDAPYKKRMFERMDRIAAANMKAALKKMKEKRMNVIAKMGVQSIEDYGWSRKIKLTCVHDSGINKGDSPENRSFTKATPSGEAWMTVDNKGVWPAFRLPSQEEGTGYRKASEHYVLFIDADEHSLEDVYRALAFLDGKDV